MKATAKPQIVHPGQQLIAGLLALGAAYIFASLAIDRGNWAYYGLAIAGIYLGVKFVYRALRSLKR